LKSKDFFSEDNRKLLVSKSNLLAPMYTANRIKSEEMEKLNNK
jgi:hypothetical protein